MNICIVTVYNTENCGSFFQAYALYQAIKNLGHNVFFLERPVASTSHAFLPHLVDAAKKIAKFDFRGGSLIMKRYSSFCKAQKIFPVITKKSNEYKSIDCFVIGSDTLWNIDNNYFYSNINRYFGIDFENTKKITYAVSVANTSKEKFKEISKLKSAVKAFSELSVRDENTRNIVSEVFNQESEMVCDPTLLLERKEYDIMIDDYKQDYSDAILIYHFGKISSEAKKQILNLKKATNKKLISFGEYRSWCDINLPFAPNRFIKCFKECSFVITNTYHGSIFSLIFQKQFADYVEDKNKIKYLLNSLHAEKSIAKYDTDLLPYLENNLDYKIINQEIIKIREKSKKYLKRNLCE